MAKKTAKAKTKKGDGCTPSNHFHIDKMIDLTKDQNDPKAVKFCNLVKVRFTKAIKAMNIPVTEMFAGNPQLLTDYMMSRSRYIQFTGQIGVLMDQCLRDAIAMSILSELVEPELKGVTYPGKWDAFNLFALARSRVNIISPADRPELGCYLTSLPITQGPPTTTEMLVSTGSAITAMRMIDYNPNRLYQFAILTAKVIMMTITTSVEKEMPLAFTTNQGERLPVRYGSELLTIITPAVSKWATDTMSDEGMTFKTRVEKLCEDLYMPIMEFVTYLMMNSGINDKYVRRILDTEVSQLSILYISDSETDILDTKSTVQYRLSPVKKDIKRFGTGEIYNGSVQLSLKLEPLYRLSQAPESAKKPELAEIGTQIKTFLQSMIQHCFNMYLAGELFIEVSDVDTPTTPRMELVEGETVGQD